jgi:hypothetical protein
MLSAWPKSNQYQFVPLKPRAVTHFGKTKFDLESIRPVTKVPGDRTSIISCRKVFDHVQNFIPTACNSRSTIGLIYWPKLLMPHFYISKIWKLCQNLRSIDINIAYGLHSWTVKAQKNCNRICNYSTVTVIVEKHVERFRYVLWFYLLQIKYPHVL